MDVVSNELTEMATHVLPAVTMLERSDVTGVGFLSHVAYCGQVLPVEGDRRPTWWMFGQLGKRLGIDALDGLDPDTTTTDELLARAVAGGRRSPAELFAAGPRGFSMPRVYGWVRERALPNGRWRLAPASMVDRLPEIMGPEASAGQLQLVSGRALHNHNSMAYGRMGYDRFDEDGAGVAIGMHPADAEARGLADGALVQIRSESGQVSAALKVDAGLRPGVVHLTHGWAKRNVTQLSSNDADPMHGQPVMTAIPVDVVGLA